MLSDALLIYSMGAYTSNFAADREHTLSSITHPSRADWITAHAVATDRKHLFHLNHRRRLVLNIGGGKNLGHKYWGGAKI